MSTSGRGRSAVCPTLSAAMSCSWPALAHRLRIELGQTPWLVNTCPLRPSIAPSAAGEDFPNPGRRYSDLSPDHPSHMRLVGEAEPCRQACEIRLALLAALQRYGCAHIVSITRQPNPRVPSECATDVEDRPTCQTRDSREARVNRIHRHRLADQVHDSSMPVFS